MLNKIYATGYVTLSVIISIAAIMLGISALAISNQMNTEAAAAATVSMEQVEETADTDREDSKDKAYYDGLVKLQRSHDETERTMRTSVENVEEETAVILSEKDYDALIRIVEAEATGEDVKGKIMIVNVIFNRVASDGFPDEIYDVIHQKINGKAQFSPISDGRYYSVPITDSTYEAVERALKGEDYAKGALFFMQRSLSSSNNITWFDSSLRKVAEHGCHEFFDY